MPSLPFSFCHCLYASVQVLGRVDLPKGISVDKVSGTLFEGKAQTVVVNGLPVNNVKWQLSPLALFVGQIRLDVKAGNIREKTTLHLKAQLKPGCSANRR